MKRFVRLMMLIIYMMFGIIPVAKAQVPFDFHTPYQEGVEIIAGATGNYYGDPGSDHVVRSYYCVDLNAPDNNGPDGNGYPVTAIADGTVVAVGDNDNYHTYYQYDVAILHAGGYYSTYVHMRSNDVSVGDPVHQGQVIGHEGSVGKSTGSHLHFCIFNSAGDSIKPSPMDGVSLENDPDSLEYGYVYGYTIISQNEEIPTSASTAIIAKADELWALDLIEYETDGGNMHWYGGPDAIDTTFIIEDWDGGTWGSGDDWVAITFDPDNTDQDRAYVLRHGFFELYRTYGGPDTFGAPLGDEMDTTRTEYTPHDGYWGTSKTNAIINNCGPTSQFTSVQRFGSATFCWYEPEWRACLADPEDAGHNDSVLPYCYELTDDALHQPAMTTAPSSDTSATTDNDGDGFTTLEGDCNDLSNGVYPGHSELEDGVDNDCDGTIDEGTSSHDDDGDGYSEDQGDCNDASNGVYPGHAELNDGVDNNCDGVVDNDVDQDGWTTEDGDCNDLSNGIYPTHPEDIDNRDNNCDGLIDNDPYPDIALYFPSSGGFYTRHNYYGQAFTTYRPLWTSSWYTQNDDEYWYQSVTCDVDGDGFDEWVTYRPTGEVIVNDSGTDTWSGSATTWATNFGVSTGPHTEYQPHCADFNGDGKDDLLLYSYLGSFKVAMSTGSSFSTPQEWCTCGNQSGQDAEFNLLTGDPNGDGLTDIIWAATNGSAWYVGFNMDPGFQWQLWYTDFGGPGYTPLVGDLNNDGLDDVTITSDTDGHWNTLHSTGTGFGPQTIWLQEDDIIDTDQVFLEDLNADGYADAIRYDPYTGSWYVGLNTGASFQDMELWLTSFGAPTARVYWPHLHR